MCLLTVIHDSRHHPYCFRDTKWTSVCSGKNSSMQEATHLLDDSQVLVPVPVPIVKKKNLVTFFLLRIVSRASYPCPASVSASLFGTSSLPYSDKIRFHFWIRFQIQIRYLFQVRNWFVIRICFVIRIHICLGSESAPCPFPSRIQIRISTGSGPYYLIIL